MEKYHDTQYIYLWLHTLVNHFTVSVASIMMKILCTFYGYFNKQQTNENV